jgi:hypothetical protein
MLSTSKMDKVREGQGGRTSTPRGRQMPHPTSSPMSVIGAVIGQERPDGDCTGRHDHQGADGVAPPEVRSTDDAMSLSHCRSRLPG